MAISLQGLDDETAWALRAELYARVPDAVMTSLALLESERSWHLRERWLAERGGLEEAVTSYAAARATARSVAGLDDRRAWALRKAAQEAAPCPRSSSIRGRQQRPRVALARAHAPPRAQDRAGDDRGAGRRARVGDARVDGAPLP